MFRYPEIGRIGDSVRPGIVHRLDVGTSGLMVVARSDAAFRGLTEAFQADAVVDLTWQGCQTYDVESWSVKKFVREELDLPFLQIVTDYSEADTEQLKVRIEAFLEMLN